MPIGADELRARVKRLPVLPRAVTALCAAVDDESADAARVVGIVADDPALAAAVLKLANSSFYGVSGRVGHLRDAVGVLGLRTLASAAMTAAVLSSFDAGQCPGFDVEGNWRHAIATAITAESLAGRRGLDPMQAYFAGLLHDIGRLALATYYPAPFAATLAAVADDGELPHVAEKRLLGLDHGEVGALIAAQWRFPADVVGAIGQHHTLSPQTGGGTLHDVLHVADNVAYALGLSGSDDEIVPPLSAEAWARMGLAPADINRLFEQVEARMREFPLDAVAA